jgi:DDE family transposase
VSQHEELDVLGGGRAAQQQDQSERVLEDQVQQPQRHAEIMPGYWRSSITAGRRHVQHSGTPQAIETDPGLAPALTALVDPQTRGDPESPLVWTTKSTRNLADA